MIIAADRRQARTIIRYVKGLLKSVPMLAQTVESETAESITLTNRVVIEVHTAASGRCAATPSSRPCSTRSPFGQPTRAGPTPTSRS